MSPKVVSESLVLLLTSFSGNISGGTVSKTTGSFSGDVDIVDKIVHTGDTNTASDSLRLIQSHRNKWK